jgi:tryptophanyl-tRNA synthetase
MNADPNLEGFNMLLGGLYSPLIKGFYNYPKMSKSFPESGVTVEMPKEEIKKRIMEGEGQYDKPENNIIYQMMASASLFSSKELKEKYESCLEGNQRWNGAKKEYLGMLVEICSKWKK